MIKSVLGILCFVVAGPVAAQVNRIEHFIVSSPKAHELYTLFQGEVALPVVWAYQRWGTFESGGLSLGNVVLEFVKTTDGNTRWGGIALEPQHTASVFIHQLDSLAIPHGQIQHTSFFGKDGKADGWSTVAIPQRLPEQVQLFVCDYKRRAEVRKNRSDAASLLVARAGGACGIVGLRELVIGARSPDQYLQAFAKLPGIKRIGQLLAFTSGPSLRIVQAEKEQILKIVISVKSLPTTADALSIRRLQHTRSTRGLFMDPAKLDGLVIQFSEE